MTRSRWSVVSLGLALFSLVAVADAPPVAAKPKLIAVVNRADWCSVCKTHGERAGKKVLMGAASDGSISVVMNDVTSEATAKHSAGELKTAGLDKAMEPFSATGVLYLFDAKTKRPLRQVTVANTDQEIQMTIDLAKKDASK